jgi:hypothetical protein
MDLQTAKHGVQKYNQRKVETDSVPE